MTDLFSGSLLVYLLVPGYIDFDYSDCWYVFEDLIPFYVFQHISVFLLG